MVTVDFLFKNMLQNNIDKVLICSKDDVVYVGCYERVNPEKVIATFTLDRRVVEMNIPPDTAIYYR